MRPKREAPEIILRNGKPAAVILDIDRYRKMLERLEDVEDLKVLTEIRKRPLSFSGLEEFLLEYSPRTRNTNGGGNLNRIEREPSPCFKLSMQSRGTRSRSFAKSGR
jgi:hypothetical protein